MSEETFTSDLVVDEDFGNLKDIILRIRPGWNWENVAIKEFTAGITNKISGFYQSSDEKVRQNQTNLHPAFKI